MKLPKPIKRIISEVPGLDIPACAGNASYFLLLSLFPLAILLLSVLQYIPVTQADLLSFIELLVPETLWPFFDYLTNDLYAGRSTAILSISVVMMLWSASRGLHSILCGLNNVTGAKETRPWLRRRLICMGYTLLTMVALLLTLLLVAIGLLVLFSASYARAYYETKNAASVFVNQLIFAVMGIGVMWLISRVPYEWYQKLSLLILAASIGLLVLVPFIGTESGGATRWLDFGFVSFQPSEIAKFGVICSFAAIMAAHTRDMKTIRSGVAPYVVILGIIAVLLYLEPHMSATLIILALGFILMTLGGTDWKYLVGLVILGCLLVAVYLLTKGYTGGRISAWLHPENDPLDKGLQVLQSQYAIGSGGLLGLGFGRGRQKYLYLPEEHNDYIFAIACEELGFVGAIGILILFALLIIRGYWIAMHARDRFSMLLAAGLTTLLALQVFLNVAVVTNLLPSTGISLPFFSYGGTALIMQLAENGIVLNVSRSITQSPR